MGQVRQKRTDPVWVAKRKVAIAKERKVVARLFFRAVTGRPGGAR